MTCRALLVLPHLEIGPSRFVLDMAAELPGIAVDAEIFSIAPGDPRDSSSAPHSDPLVGVTYGSPPWWRRSYWFPTMVARLVRAAARADVVVAGNEVGAGLAGAFVAGEATKTPVMAVAHRNLIASLDAAGGWDEQVARFVYPRLDAVVCVSRGVVPTAVALGVPKERVHFIPNGTDPRRVAMLASEPPPEWLPDGALVVGVGPLTKQKGFDLLIEAHAALKGRSPPHRLVIVGEGPERKPLEALASRLELSDTVHLPGYIRNPLPIVARASLCCLPSRCEGSPLVLSEALALGVPVIAADCVSGPPEVLGVGPYGDLVKAGSAAALASAIARHLQQPQRLATKSLAYKANADAYSVVASAREYASLFKAILTRRSPPVRR